MSRKTPIFACFFLVGLLALTWGAVQAPQAQSERPGGGVALSAAIEGPIGPATARHVEKALEATAERNAQVLILRLNTPGGLVTSMREIIADILASDVPVIGYVSPSGAHAASAGTYILYATHVAAMAPGTNLGAATPVQMGGGFPGGGEEEKGDDAGGGRDDAPSDLAGDAPGDNAPEAADDETGADESQTASKPARPDNAMEAKATNDAVAFIRSLAEIHGRNGDWAEKAVREAASLSAQGALERNVIDLIAPDEQGLLVASDGRQINMNDTTVAIETAGLEIEEFEPDFVTELLGILSNPNVAFILMMIGVYGLIFEFSNPGTIGPGVIGVICLVLGLYALNQLPLDYAGLALVLLGIGFMVAEAFTPTMGALGIGGLVAFVLGAAMLIDTDVPAFQLSWTVIVVVTVLTGGLFMLLLGYLWRSLRRPVAVGTESLIGTSAQVLDWSGKEGFVWAEGERWHAEGPQEFSPGDRVRIAGKDGLTVKVEPPGAAAGPNSNEGA